MQRRQGNHSDVHDVLIRVWNEFHHAPEAWSSAATDRLRVHDRGMMFAQYDTHGFLEEPPTNMAERQQDCPALRLAHH